MRPALQLLVRHNPEAGLNYEAHLFGATETTGGVDAFRDVLVKDLNEARSLAGAPPVGLEVNQSRDNEELVPHFFASASANRDRDADLITLGLMAGWDVVGMIRDGGIFSGVVSSSRSPARWVSHALASPLGRWCLLEPSMTRVAVGVAPVDPAGEMALITTYAFFDSTDHGSDEQRVFENLTKTRRTRGIAPPHRVATDAVLRWGLDRVAKSEQSSLDALQEAIERVGAETDQTVGGSVVETSDLDHLPFRRLSPSRGRRRRRDRNHPSQVGRRRVGPICGALHGLRP